MKLTVSWPRPDHVLVRRPSVIVNLGNDPDLDLAVAQGKATVFTPGFSTHAVRLRVKLAADSGANPVTLSIDQFFDVTATAAAPRNFRVVDPEGTVRHHPGLHPRLRSTVSGQSWQVVVENRLVDATGLVPAGAPGLAVDPVNPANASMIRVLARTDGVLPAFWVTCTPKVCRGAAASDLLCMLTAPQDTPVADVGPQGVPADVAGLLRRRRAVFLGHALHTGDLAFPPGDPRARHVDHFTQVDGDALPNFILARGWEQALVDSGRHVALVLPVPSSGSHHLAAGGRLPELLADVFALLRTAGDVAPPDQAPGERPRVGVGGHSLGAKSALTALQARSAAYTDVLLFDPARPTRDPAAEDAQVKAEIAALAVSPASICLAGMSVKTARLAGRLRDHPTIGPRLRPLPAAFADVDTAAIAAFVARSPSLDGNQNPISLAHALQTLSSRPQDWAPRPKVPTHGKVADERFEMLHQYVVFGGDNQGSPDQSVRHFLTQALQGSTFR